METSLHRQLKALYCDDPAQQEVGVDGYRIDAVADGRLVEIQYGSLAAIRDKINALLAVHRVLIVKPLAARKYLIRRSRKGGRVVSSRYSPTRQSYYDLFDDLVHFVGVFPHPRLTLEVVLTEQEEHRLPAAGRRLPAASWRLQAASWRSWRKSYRVEDRKLRAVYGRMQLHTAADLLGLLPDETPQPFSTADIARHANIPRRLAQKMAYCLRKTEAAVPVGKHGNTVLYCTAATARRVA